jgi:hypothetical protein
MMFALTACPKGGSGDGTGLAGIWADEGGGQRTTISMVSGQPTVTSIIDADGEKFEVRRSGYQGGNYSWDYHVPSTGYDVHIQVNALNGDRMETTWSNHVSSGDEALVRLQ